MHALHFITVIAAVFTLPASSAPAKGNRKICHPPPLGKHFCNIFTECFPHYPSETNNYVTPKAAISMHLRSLKNATVYGAHFRGQDDIEDDLGLGLDAANVPTSFVAAASKEPAHRPGYIPKCCRMTWECWKMFDWFDIKNLPFWPTQDAEDKATCCLEQYYNSCDKPQKGELYHFTEPKGTDLSGCSNALEAPY